MEAPSNSEIILLQKLKLLIEDLKLEEDFLEDKNLVRWLRGPLVRSIVGSVKARKQNLENAEKMIRKSREWYLNNNIDNVMETYDPKWDEAFPVYGSGFNYDGGPVLVLELGKWDAYKAMASGHKAQLNQHGIIMLHLVWLIMQKQSASMDNMVQSVGIYDFEGLSLRQVTCYDGLETALHIGRVFEANYPETLKKGFVLNAPWAFQILWKAVRPIMDERTVEKVMFLGSDSEIWREEISKVVPLDQFPERYGGTGPNNCSKLIKFYKPDEVEEDKDHVIST